MSHQRLNLQLPWHLSGTNGYGQNTWTDYDKIQDTGDFQDVVNTQDAQDDTKLDNPPYIIFQDAEDVLNVKHA